MAKSIFDRNPEPTPNPYATVNDLPIPVREHIVTLHRVRELPASEIAKLFSIPEQWVQLFVECPPGSTQH